jgi:hypothetical protein
VTDIERHAERMKRARLELADPPPARSHTERMDAAQGVHVYGDNIRTPYRQRARILKHRDGNE